MTVTVTVAGTVAVAVAGRAYGCRRATRVGGGDTKQNQFFRFSYLGGLFIAILQLLVD